MKLNGISWLAVVLIGAISHAAEKHSEMKDCPLHQQYLDQANSHFAGVTERGDKARLLARQDRSPLWIDTSRWIHCRGGF